MASNTVWGLDIGNSAIKAVKMTRSGTECTIVDFDILDLPLIENETERPARVKEALQALAQNHKFGSDHVYVSVVGNVCLHREFQLPPGSEDKLRDLVQYEAKQQISLPLEQVEWNFEIFDDPAGVGIALIAVRKNEIQDLMSVCESAGLNVRGITPAPLALFNFINYEFRPENTTLILDAGAKGTDFVVMNKRQVYFRTIQIAGREITRVLENKFKVPYDKAEELKKNISKSPQAEKILTVIEPTLRQLGAEVQRTVGFYKSKARGQKIGQAYLLGHTFRLPKMAEYLQTQVREAPFALVEGLQRVKLAETISSEVWDHEFPTLAVAIGLGLQGLRLSELKLNLLPGSKESEIERDRWKPWVIAATVMLIATLGYSYTQAQSKNADYEQELVDLKHVTETAKKNDAAMAAVLTGVPEMKLQADRWAHVAADRGKLAPIFSRILALQSKDKPFFGAENKVYVTGLYVSRIPPSNGGGLPESQDRQNISKGHDILNGKNSLYKALANPKADEPLNAPLEMRPDIPMVVILSGEVESARTRQVCTQLEDLLKSMPEVQNLAIEPNENGPTYTEQVPTYLWGGEIKPSDKPADEKAGAATVAADVKKTQYGTFHAMFRWNPKSSPDREPAERAAAPVAAKTAGKDAAAKPAGSK